MPNNPTLDASVQWRINQGTIDLREPGYRGTAEAILDGGLATEVRRLISAGKEADVYLCGYNGAPLAVKAYRLYRTSHRGGRPIKADTMSWLAAHEFEMMRQAWKGGAPVPTPARRVENLLSMRYLGDPDEPAPRLHDVRLDAPEAFLHAVLSGVDSLAAAGVVHSDLSDFNILVHDGMPWFIDFSDSIRVDRTGGVPWIRLTQARDALIHGFRALETYFRRYGLSIDAEFRADRIVARLDRFGVLKKRDE
ncbi:MAG TPA: RIO1 family regulatory kinase/ATPase [Thermoplasmata archaeon]|jgi:RIO kinase 1|nr:RIO1 family regulatory kinase/ATPase [Thermoplasmata archaeon]